MSAPTDLSPDDLLAQATCAVLIEGKVKGTAWLVSDEGHLLTAGHLLGTDKPCDEVEIRFAEDVPYKAYKIQWGYQQEMGIDFAVLKLPGSPVNRRPLPVSLAQVVKGTFRLQGYGVSLKDRSVGVGEFIGPFDPQNSPGNRLFQLRSPELGEGGYSGAAVFSDELQAVVAIQVEATRATTGSGRDTILAMPLYRIAQTWGMLPHIWEKNKPLASNGVQGKSRRSVGSSSNTMVGQEDWKTKRIESLRRQLAVFYESQNYLEEQAALTMPTIPLSVINSLNEVKKSIVKIKAELTSLGEELEFLPTARTPPTSPILPPSLWLYEKGHLVQIIDLAGLDWKSSVVTIGRSRICDIQVDLKYSRVGRQHARLVKEEANFILYDGVGAPSNLGTYVNGERLGWEAGKVLEDGAQIVFGGLDVQGQAAAKGACFFIFRST